MIVCVRHRWENPGGLLILRDMNISGRVKFNGS